MVHESDKILLEKIKNDPELGFKLLFKDYQQPLYYYVRKIVFNHADSDDIMQNVWLKVFHNIQNFRGDSKLSTWLYKIATNETYSFLKKEANKHNMSLENLSHSIAQSLYADIYFNGDEVTLKLYESIAQLPERQRKVFQLKYFEEKKYEEISEILEVSVGSLKASYHHAVKKLKIQIPKVMKL